MTLDDTYSAYIFLYVTNENDFDKTSVEAISIAYNHLKKYSDSMVLTDKIRKIYKLAFDDINALSEKENLVDKVKDVCIYLLNLATEDNILALANCGTAKFEDVKKIVTLYTNIKVLE